MCMITTAVRLGDEASKGNTSAASGAMRDSSRGNSYSSTANDSEESTRSPSHLPTPQVEGLAQNGVPAEKRRSTVVSSFLSGVSPPKKQRIQVIVRIRPIDDTACRTTTVLADGRTLCLAPAPKGAKEKLDQGRLRESRKELEVTFDRVLGEGAEQKEVYDQVKACVRLPFSGVNSCIFAYGQTGSGKTYSMMGATAQLGTEKASAGSNETSHSQQLGKCEAVEADEENRFAAVGTNSNEQGELGTQDAAGVIPRAVDDIFRIVRQGRVRGNPATAPHPEASDRCSVREPTEGPQPPQAGTAPSPNPAFASGGPFARDSSSPGTSHSCRSGGSSSSEASSLAEVPSAAHWPLSEPFVYVPRGQMPRTGLLSPTRQTVQPCRGLEKCDAVGTEESSGSDEKLKACREGHGGETGTTCKYSVQCSYLQVYNGRVYDLLSPHASQHRPLPILASARQGAAAGLSVDGRDESAEDGSGEASTYDVAGKRRFSTSSFSRREGCSESHLVGLSAHAVDSAEQVMELLRQGNRNRRVRSTEMNTHSSRSHTIVQLTISSTTGETVGASHLASGGQNIDTAALETAPTAASPRRRPHHPREDGDGDGGNIAADDEEAAGEMRSDREVLHGTGANAGGGGKKIASSGVTTRAKLSLVDLAGSEKRRVGGERGTERGDPFSQAGPPPLPTQGEDNRGAAQERERSRINSSLSALSNCISCLGEARRTHVPFRDNPLTRLLQDSLVGGKTVVIATIRPSVDAQAESISTLNFAARCMRVVARHRVNEVVSDTLLLERARRQISALRRRLVEAEAAAATASSPAPPPSCDPLPSDKAEPPPISAEKPGQSPRPSPLPAETKAVVLATAPDTRSACSSAAGRNGGGAYSVGVCGETARSGDGRRHMKYASVVAAPRGGRPREQAPGEILAGHGSNTAASERVDALAAEASSSSGKRCARAANQAPAVAASKSEAMGRSRLPLHADERTHGGGADTGQPRKPLSSPSSSLPAGGEKTTEGGGVKIRTLLNARRGRDIVVRGKIATAVAAANAAAAAASAVAAAISAAGGGRSRHPFAVKHATRTAPSVAVQRGSPRGAARPQLRKSGGAARASKAARKPAFRSSSSSSSSSSSFSSLSSSTPGRPAQPARGASNLASVSPAGAAEAGGGHANETGIATQALIERFSTREEELLREVEAWKARCKSLEEKDPPQLRSVDGGGRALASQCGVGVGERRGGEKPTSRVEAAPTATLAVPPGPADAKPQRPLYAISKASPSIALPEEGALDANHASASSHRIARGGFGTVSVPNAVVLEQGRSVDPPRRRASVEVLQQCADGWWYRRLPSTPREPCLREEAEPKRLEGNPAFKSGEPPPGAVDDPAVCKPGEPPPGTVDDRADVPATEAVVAGRVAQDGGINNKAGGQEVDVERAASRTEKRAAKRTAVGQNGETHGAAMAPTPGVVIESGRGPPQDEGAQEAMKANKRPPPQSFKAEEMAIYDCEEKGARGNDVGSRPSESVLPRPRVGGAVLPPARSRNTDRDGSAQSSRSRNADQGTKAGGAQLGFGSMAEAFGSGSTPSPPPPLSSDSVRDTGFVSTTALGGKGCQRHGLAPCSLCGARDSSPLPRSDDRRSAPPFTGRAQHGDNPCDRHLLLDCILCKMLSPTVVRGGGGLSPASFGRTTPRQHVLGRSTSLPALGGTATSGGDDYGIRGGDGGGDSGGGVDTTGALVTGTKTAFDRGGGPSTYRCDRHDLLGCFLCGSRTKSPTAPRGGGPAESRHPDDGPALHPAPRLVLPSPMYHGGGVHVGGASSPAGAFVVDDQQPYRRSKGAALGSGSASSEMGSAFGDGVTDAGDDGVPKKYGTELVGGPVVYRAPRQGEAAGKVNNSAALPPAEANGCEEPSSSDVTKHADFGFVGRRPWSDQRTPSLYGDHSENRPLAGGDIARARGSSGGTSTDGVQARGASGRRGADAAADAVRHRRQHRSRGGTPRRRRTPPKPYNASLVVHDPGRGRHNRSLQGSMSIENGGAARGRARANTIASATRAREKLGDDDLAARAMTAALAVLQ